MSYDKNLVIQEENNYYPFGLKQEGYNIAKNSTNDGLRYKYNGKELQDENIGGNLLNLYDYGARNYDPALCRWMNIDPLAETSRRFSPYLYAVDNPILFIDPDGMEVIGADGLTNDQWLEASRPGSVKGLAKQYETQNKEEKAAYEYAILCKDAYYSDGKSIDTGDYTLLKRYGESDTGFKAALYKNADKYFLAIAGTDDLVDTVEDGTQLLGIEKQYSQGLELVNNLSKIPEIRGNLTITGHSLGGGISQYISMKTGIPCSNF